MDKNFAFLQSLSNKRLKMLLLEVYEYSCGEGVRKWYSAKLTLERWEDGIILRNAERQYLVSIYETAKNVRHYHCMGMDRRTYELDMAYLTGRIRKMKIEQLLL